MSTKKPIQNLQKLEKSSKLKKYLNCTILIFEFALKIVVQIENNC